MLGMSLLVDFTVGKVKKGALEGRATSIYLLKNCNWFVPVPRCVASCFIFIPPPIRASHLWRLFSMLLKLVLRLPNRGNLNVFVVQCEANAII